MIKEVYFTETKWKPIHDNLGGVSGKIVFKEPVSYQDYLSISRKEYLLLDENQDKEIERLIKVEKEHQKINGELREENKKLNNIMEAIEKALKDNIEELKDLTFSYDRIHEDKEILKLIQELKGSDKHE